MFAYTICTTRAYIRRHSLSRVSIALHSLLRRSSDTHGCSLRWGAFPPASLAWMTSSYGRLTEHRLYLIEGMPGSGKTTLAFQYLIEGAGRGERVLT